MSRSAKVFIQCAVALALAAIVYGVLGSQPLYAQAVSSQASADAQAACASDVQKLCAGVQSGGGRIIACLKQHQAEVSDGCKQAIVKAMRTSGQGTGSGSVAPASSAPQPSSSPAASQGTGAGSASSGSAAPANSAPQASSSPAASHGAVAGSATSGSVAPANSAPQASSSPAASHRAVAGSAASGSYLLLKKAQILVDDPDFDKTPSTPSPAIEMLIPSTWDFKGTVRMYGGKTGCFNEAFSTFWEATSADGATKFQGVPNYAWQYSDDPQELHKLTDTNRRTHNGGKTNDLCPVAKPLSAEQYFRQMVLSGLQPAMTVVSVEPFPALEQMVRQNYGLPTADAGNGAARVDAIRVRLSFQKDDKPMELWYSVALLTRTYRVGQGYLYDLDAVSQVALGAPKGELDANDKLFKVVMASIQPLPRYTAYTNKWIAYYYKIQANKEAAMDQIQADLINTITQTYLNMSANAQKVSDIGFHANEQNLRDVQTFRDPSTGQMVELSNQYGHAWLNGNNQYVMSDDSNFDPNSALMGSWNELQPVQP